MKIRNGFVSNSSSSNFVVAFPAVPKSTEDVKNLLFGEAEIWPIHRGVIDVQILTSQLAEIIWADIQAQIANNKRSILKAIDEGWFDGAPQYNEHRFRKEGDDKEIDWDKYGKERNAVAKQIRDKFLKDNPNSFVYVFEYGDNDGDTFVALEHEEVFSALPYLRISCH